MVRHLKPGDLWRSLEISGDRMRSDPFDISERRLGFLLQSCSILQYLAVSCSQVSNCESTTILDIEMIAQPQLSRRDSLLYLPCQCRFWYDWYVTVFAVKTLNAVVFGWSCELLQIAKIIKDDQRSGTGTHLLHLSVAARCCFLQS